MAEVGCVVACENELGELPVWNASEGALYWVDAFAPAIYRYDPASGVTGRFDAPNVITSLAFREAGGLAATMMSGYYFVDLDRMTFDLIASPQESHPDLLYNDGKCDRRGRYWCGTMNRVRTSMDPIGQLWRLDADLSTHRMDTGFIVSNGIAWSPDDRTFYFADTRAETVFAYDFDIDDGAISNRRVFFSTKDMPGRVDGAAVDSAWLLLVCNGRCRPDRPFRSDGPHGPFDQPAGARSDHVRLRRTKARHPLRDDGATPVAAAGAGGTATGGWCVRHRGRRGARPAGAAVRRLNASCRSSPRSTRTRNGSAVTHRLRRQAASRAMAAASSWRV